MIKAISYRSTGNKLSGGSRRGRCAGGGGARGGLFQLVLSLNFSFFAQFRQKSCQIIDNSLRSRFLFPVGNCGPTTQTKRTTEVAKVLFGSTRIRKQNDIKRLLHAF